MTKIEPTSACPTGDLLLFHYGELDDAGELRIEQHLQQCHNCCKELDKLRKFLNLLPTAKPDLSATELRRFNSRVMSQLPRRRRLNKLALGWTLAGAVVLMLTLNLGQQTEPQIPAPAPLVAEQEILENLELLQNLDLLENLELLQQLASQG
jgi:hypothetical protein